MSLSGCGSIPAISTGGHRTSDEQRSRCTGMQSAVADCGSTAGSDVLDGHNQRHRDVPHCGNARLKACVISGLSNGPVVARSGGSTPHLSTIAILQQADIPDRQIDLDQKAPLVVGGFWLVGEFKCLALSSNPVAQSKAPLEDPRLRGSGLRVYSGPNVNIETQKVLIFQRPVSIPGSSARAVVFRKVRIGRSANALILLTVMAVHKTRTFFKSPQLSENKGKER
jgi:hypothetical protein